MTAQKATATALVEIEPEAAPAATAMHPAPAAAAPGGNNSARTALLTAPILPTLLKLALPTMTVLVAQTAVNIAEAYYVGFLGTDALGEVA